MTIWLVFREKPRVAMAPMSWVSFRSLLAVAVGAPNVALGYLFVESLDAEVAGKLRNRKALFTALLDVVKLKNFQVLFPTINARMGKKVFDEYISATVSTLLLAYLFPARMGSLPFL
jgi:hypothetical protein